jgi:hypothetical protein
MSLGFLAMPEQRRLTAAVVLALLVVAPALCGCTSLLSEGAAAGAGIGGASIAHSLNANGAVTAGVGIGTQAAALAGVQYLEKRIHKTEQDAIAAVAGPLPVGQVVHWSVTHDLPIEDNEQGELTVSRIIVTAPPTATDALDCKEIVFSVDTVEKNVPQRAFYTASVCRDGPVWRWATAEPSTERWGSLQ